MGALLRAIFAAVILGVVALAVVRPAAAVEPDELLPDAAMEQRARAISAELRCLVCQNQSIDDSNAPLARDLRLLVRERLKAGDSDAGVKSFVVARYGEFVLLRPLFGLHTAILWLGPPLLLLATVLALMVWSRRMRQVASSSNQRLSDEEEARLAALLIKVDRADADGDRH
jgi:cytochrome c-type biogenesis protein CcmH